MYIETWEVIRPEHDDRNNPALSYGKDQEQAIAKYCENNFSNWEYPQMIKIWIRLDKNHEWEKFIVEVHSVPEFKAYKDI